MRGLRSTVPLTEGLGGEPEEGLGGGRLREEGEQVEPGQPKTNKFLGTNRQRGSLRQTPVLESEAGGPCSLGLCT